MLRVIPEFITAVQIIFLRSEICFVPGRQTTERKGGSFSFRRESNDNRFLVFAEDAAEGVGDFADGGVGFDGGEDGGEKICGGGGAALEFSEGGLCFGGVALGAESVQA